MLRKFIISLATILSITSIVIGLLIFINKESPSKEMSPQPITADRSNDIPQQPSPDTTQVNEPRSLLLAAVGDIMVHQEQMDAALVMQDGQKHYDFDFTFSEVKSYLERADLVIGNLETTIAGEANRGYTGYPEFNSPESLLPALKRAGFDVVSTANNHSLDRREAGVIATLDKLDEYGLLYSGTARSEDERNQPVIVDRNGIRVAVLSYTYGTNGIPIPTGKNYLVNVIDEQLMKDDIARVRDEVDFVIVCMHYGHEYHRLPNSQQVSVSDFLVENGADIVLGSHPHVLQPAKWKDNAFIIYSMGNFVSGQRGDYKDNGVIVYLQLNIDEHGKPSISEAKFVPTYVQKFWHQGKSQFRILAAAKSIEDYEQKRDPLLREFDYTKLQQAHKATVEHLTIVPTFHN